MERFDGGLRGLVQPSFGSPHLVRLPVLGDCTQNGARDMSGVDVHHVADKRRAGSIALAENARAAAIGKAIGRCAELMLDHVAALFDHEHGFEPIRESACAFFFKRPDEADFVDANAERRGVALMNAEIAKRLPDMEIAFAGGRDAEAGPRAIEDDAVEPVRASKRHRGWQPEMAVHLFLLRRRQMKSAISSAGRVGNVFRDHRLVAVDVDPDGGACVHRVRDGLDADPKPGEAREIEALHAELDHFRDIGGVQDRNFRIHEGKVALVRKGRGLAGMIVAREGENAAVARRAEHGCMFEGVARPVHARPFAVPDAENAVIAGAGEEPDLLAAPDGRRRQFLVYARLEDNVMIGEALALAPKVFVINSKWRTAISRNKSCRVQTTFSINFTAQQRKPDKSLNAGDKDLARLR